MLFLQRGRIFYSAAEFLSHFWPKFYWKELATLKKDGFQSVISTVFNHSGLLKLRYLSELNAQFIKKGVRSWQYYDRFAHVMKCRTDGTKLRETIVRQILILVFLNSYWRSIYVLQKSNDNKKLSSDLFLAHGMSGANSWKGVTVFRISCITGNILLNLLHSFINYFLLRFWA